jgi:ribokinase
MRSNREGKLTPLPRLVVVGPIARDTAVAVRQMPGAGGVVDAEGFHTAVGGKGGTAALVAAAFGAEVALVGAIGADDQGDLALAELRAAGVDVDAVERLDGEATGHVLTWVGPDAGRRHVEWHGANAWARRGADELERTVAGVDAVLISGASPGALVEAAVEAGRRTATRVVLDASGDPATIRRVLADVDIVRADSEEAAGLVESRVEDFASAEEAARRLLAAGPAIAAVQAGEEGDVVFAGSALEAGGLGTASGTSVAEVDEALRLPHLGVDVVDPTGAGDAFVTTLTVLLCAERTIPDAACLASAAAAHTASHLGGRPTFAGEADIVRFLAGHRAPG